MTAIEESLSKHNLPGRAAVTAGNGGLPKLVLTTPWSEAEIYLHGAHITGFKKKDEPPLLFMSAASHFTPDKPIRGGVPICFPWFGPREGLPAHGYARLTDWELILTEALPDGSVTAHFRLPANAGGINNFGGKLDFIVTVGETLTMELITTNTTTETVKFENLFHTYLSIGDINEIFLTGLKGAAYVDKVDGSARKTETADTLRITSEVDRVFPDSTTTVEIHDPKLRRTIRVEKKGSASTVVWNPWIAKSKVMADFGDEEFKEMVCVESGNVAQDKITLTPEESASLLVVLSSHAL